MKIRTKKVAITRPQDIAEVMFKVYATNDKLDREREQLYLISLDTRNNITSLELISLGTINESLISIREIYRTALMRNAVSIMLIHNHPSGDPTPSTEDITVTQAVHKAGKFLGLPLLDHLIIANKQYVSMKAQGYLIINERNR